MIMMAAIIYFFLSYVMFIQPLKITFRKSSAPPLKKPTKNCASPPPVLPNIITFSAPPSL